MASLADDLRGGFLRSSAILAAASAQMPDNVFNHDHRTVYHHSEIEGAQ